MIKLSEIYATRKMIKKWIRKTPFELSPKLSKIIGGSVYLKLENQQITKVSRYEEQQTKFSN